MAALSVAEMRALEASAIRDGWSEERLMDLAGARLAQAIARFFPVPGTIIGYLGKGHNAGDALIALRLLRGTFGWKVAARTAFPPSGFAPLTREKWEACGLDGPLGEPPSWRDLPRPLVLLDGLLGIGASGALRPPLAGLAEEMNSLRRNAGAKTAAVDLPSGTDPDSGEIFPGGVTADITFMIGAAKRGLLSARAVPATGALAVVPVDPLTPGATGEIEIISPQSLGASAGPPRPFDFHKGDAGRVGLFVGSVPYSGAAVLAASGALRGGAGLVTVHAAPDAARLISAKCPPEVMVRPCGDPRELLDFRYDSLVIGCGLSEPDAAARDALFALISATSLPTVIDAEALNAIGRSKGLHLLKENHVITPHPGEFRRLVPDLADLPREQAARDFASAHPSTLLLKGTRTLVARAEHPLGCNSTGNPGMASGGQGDLLAGVIGARLAAGESPWIAACFGAWLCGRAAEHALNDPRVSEESLLPGEVLQHLGAAFRDWRASLR